MPTWNMEPKREIKASGYDFGVRIGVRKYSSKMELKENTELGVYTWSSRLEFKYEVEWQF